MWYSVIEISDEKRVRMLPASAANLTRVYRVAGDNSTTEPPMLAYTTKCVKLYTMVIGHEKLATRSPIKFTSIGVAGDNSTTKPPMLAYIPKCLKIECVVLGQRN